MPATQLAAPPPCRKEASIAAEFGDTWGFLCRAPRVVRPPPGGLAAASPCRLGPRTPSPDAARPPRPPRPPAVQRRVPHPRAHQVLRPQAKVLHSVAQALAAAAVAAGAAGGLGRAGACCWAPGAAPATALRSAARLPGRTASAAPPAAPLRPAAEAADVRAEPAQRRQPAQRAAEQHRHRTQQRDADHPQLRRARAVLPDQQQRLRRQGEHRAGGRAARRVAWRGVAWRGGRRSRLAGWPLSCSAAAAMAGWPAAASGTILACWLTSSELRCWPADSAPPAAPPRSSRCGRPRRRAREAGWGVSGGGGRDVISWGGRAGCKGGSGRQGQAGGAPHAAWRGCKAGAARCQSHGAPPARATRPSRAPISLPTPPRLAGG
jgi:hypothetical protein